MVSLERGCSRAPEEHKGTGLRRRLVGCRTRAKYWQHLGYHVKRPPPMLNGKGFVPTKFLPLHECTRLFAFACFVVNW